MIEGYRVIISQHKHAGLERYFLDESCSPDEVFGRTIMTLVSPGTETALYRGAAGIDYPIWPGYAAILVIEKTGSAVKNLTPGDTVFGVLPHQSVVRARECDLIRLPSGLQPEFALFARIAAISMSTLVTTRARPPQIVCVNGLGIVGNLATQIFQNCGYEVYACDTSSARRDYAVRNGIHHVEKEIPSTQSALSGTVSLFLECRGNERDVLFGCRIVAKGGEVVLIGVPWREKTTTTAFEILHEVFHRYVYLRSGWEWELPVHAHKAGYPSTHKNLTAALDWLEDGRIRLDGLYSMYSPSQIDHIYRKFDEHQFHTLTAVLDWRQMT